MWSIFVLENIQTTDFVPVHATQLILKGHCTTVQSMCNEYAWKVDILIPSSKLATGYE